jgi:hypothetical protein
MGFCFNGNEKPGAISSWCERSKRSRRFFFADFGVVGLVKQYAKYLFNTVGGVENKIRDDWFDVGVGLLKTELKKCFLINRKPLSKKIIQSSSVFLQNNSKIIFAIIVVLFLVFYSINRTNHTDKHGLITVAKVMKYEPAESGSSLEINIYLKDKVISTSVSTGCYFCVGKFFFIKVLKDDPKSYPLLILDKPVPDCIIEKVQYFKGWDSIPSCDNY